MIDATGRARIAFAGLDDASPGAGLARGLQRDRQAAHRRGRPHRQQHPVRGTRQR
ncbi:hypothetical protein [Thauera humireducens]|uniref:hypothetical protein n=1 Tax=Thauera humireducens TaxID=1134435 RepID=UPI00311EF022